MNGVICVDKPSGKTSFDIVSFVKKITHEKKCGHAGTLDPMATGVLPVFLGESTKAISILPNKNKSYSAKLRLGIVTDTGDITGKVLEKNEANFSFDEVRVAVSSFKGRIEQIPPMYSALKYNGRHLYDIAREGGEVERKIRPIEIYNIELKGKDVNGDFLIDVDCSQGTYIRTLCEDIGKKLGCGGTMSALRRTFAAGFKISECFTEEELESLANEDKLNTIIRNVENIFASLPKVFITEKQAVRFRNGGKLSLERVKETLPDGLCSVYYGSLFIGVGETDNESGEIGIKGHFNRDIAIG